jgi:hypothetical protein
VAITFGVLTLLYVLESGDDGPEGERS